MQIFLYCRLAWLARIGLDLLLRVIFIRTLTRWPRGFQMMRHDIFNPEVYNFAGSGDHRALDSILIGQVGLIAVISGVIPCCVRQTQPVDACESDEEG